MVETPRLQAKQVFYCREATCHSGQRARIQKITLLKLLDAPESSTGQASQVLHDEKLTSTTDFKIPRLVYEVRSVVN